VGVTVFEDVGVPAAPVLGGVPVPVLAGAGAEAAAGSPEPAVDPAAGPALLPPQAASARLSASRPAISTIFAYAIHPPDAT
jgi:hypothetical protein